MSEILTGPEVQAIMRRHRITIRRAAEVFRIPMTRVREVRANGVSGELGVWEWGTFLVEKGKGP
jgi:hypothetical protein